MGKTIAIIATIAIRVTIIQMAPAAMIVIIVILVKKNNNTPHNSNEMTIIPNLDEIVVFDYSNLNYQENSINNCYGCDNCNTCDHDCNDCDTCNNCDSGW